MNIFRKIIESGFSRYLTSDAQSIIRDSAEVSRYVDEKKEQMHDAINEKKEEIIDAIETPIKEEHQKIVDSWENMKDDVREGFDDATKGVREGIGKQVDNIRDLDSGVREGIDAAKLKGKHLGRPFGAKSKSLKLSKNTKRVKDLMAKGLPKAQIALVFFATLLQILPLFYPLPAIRLYD